MITLTVAEIYDLACMSGFTINHRPDFMPDADDMEAEIVIIECPKQGVRDDEGKAIHYAHVAYFAEYPEEGSYPLGKEIGPCSEHQSAVQAAAGGLTQTPLLPRQTTSEETEITDKNWTHVSLEHPKAVKFTVSGQEWIDGNLFLVTRVYGADGRLESARYTRADLVRG